jgi:shikimate kinase
MARVEAQGDYRPMRNRPNAMAELQALLRARTPLYEQAHAVVDTSAGPEASLAALEVAVEWKTRKQVDEDNHS